MKTMKVFPILLAAAGSASMGSAQGILDKLPPEVKMKRETGMSVQPAYEGWQRQKDGSYVMWFGYLNRNTVEEVEVPLGANNSFSDGQDHAQPTHFLPRRHQFVFKVAVPKDWD